MIRSYSQEQPWNWPCVKSHGPTMDPAQFLGVVNIPEGTAGNFTITKFKVPANIPLNVGRYALGQVYAMPWGEHVSYDHETTWTSLNSTSPPFCWMSDIPIEQVAIRSEIGSMTFGTVLVGGLGLGFVASLLARQPGVKKVVVVEKAPEVIQLVGQHLLKDDAGALAKVSIVQADLIEYAKECPERFDHAFYDIWPGPSQDVFFSTVCPLLQLSERFVGTRPVCWAEPLMRLELYQVLTARVAWLKHTDQAMVQWLRWALSNEIKGDTAMCWNWSVQFFQRGKFEDSDIRAYVGQYGEPASRSLWAL